MKTDRKDPDGVHNEESDHSPTGRPSGSQRFGSLVAIAINGVMLYVAYHLVEWDWLDFLTREFDDLLPLLTLSFGAAIVEHACSFWRSDQWLKVLGRLVGSGIGLVLSVRTLQIFPFDFSAYSLDWSWPVRVLLVVSVVATAVSVVANLVKLALWRLLT